MSLAFTKMHGAGNDFIVLDLRDGRALPARETLMRMADRHYGIGCDQLMILLPSSTATSLASYRIVNGDGSDARQCGNGARCLAAWLHRDGALHEKGVLDSPSGPVPIQRLKDGSFEVTLGVPDFRAEAVPMQTLPQGPDGWRLQLEPAQPLLSFGAVGLGNPHVVIELEDVLSAPVPLAFALQGHPAFPAGCNVGFVQVLARDRLRLRVIERGVGETLACGSGACAAHAWLHRRGRIDAQTTVELPGGNLGIHWAGGEDEAVRMRGPTTTVFEGHWPT